MESVVRLRSRASAALSRRSRVEQDADQRQQLQHVLFPEGLRFDGKKFGTAVACLAFKQLDENGKLKSGLASPTGFEPVF
jgi:hypothetical protein